MKLPNFLKPAADGLVDSAASIITDSVVKKYLEKQFENIIEIKALRVVRRRPEIYFTLCGVPEREIFVRIEDISIEDDGRLLRIGRFTSNTLFAETLFNNYCPGDIPIENETLAVAAKKLSALL